MRRTAGGASVLTRSSVRPRPRAPPVAVKCHAHALRTASSSFREVRSALVCIPAGCKHPDPHWVRTTCRNMDDRQQPTQSRLRNQAGDFISYTECKLKAAQEGIFGIPGEPAPKDGNPPTHSSSRPLPPPGLQSVMRRDELQVRVGGKRRVL